MSYQCYESHNECQIRLHCSLSKLCTILATLCSTETVTSHAYYGFEMTNTQVAAVALIPFTMHP